MITTVLFDIDGVLIDSTEANKQFYRDLVTLAGYPQPSDDVFNKIISLTAMETIPLLTGETNQEKIHTIWKLMDQIKYRPGLQKLFPLAKETLKSLKQNGYHLGLVTSRVRHGLDELNQLFESRTLFESTVAFEDYTHPKPDPEPIVVALKRLHAKPEESVYIGDALIDQQAARAAGVHFIGYRNPELTGDMFITKFSELIPALNQLKTATP